MWDQSRVFLGFVLMNQTHMDFLSIICDSISKFHKLLI